MYVLVYDFIDLFLLTCLMTEEDILILHFDLFPLIKPHQDGPLYHPVVSTISLGSHSLLDFYTSLDSATCAEAEDQVM